jgi:hypothetical protein
MNAVEMETDMDDYPTMVSTSNEGTIQTVVMRWEDPFHSLLSQNNQNQEDGGNNEKSTRRRLCHSRVVSRVSSPRPIIAILPYRTIDIDSQESFNAEASKVKLDRWNMADDMTFRPYLIRDAGT